MKRLTGGVAKAAGMALAALVLGGCAMKRAPAEPDTLVLFGNGQAAGLRVQLAAPGGQLDLAGASVSTPNTAKAFFLDINASLMNTDGTISRDVMPDLLHLSEKGYTQWARAIAPTLGRLVSLP